MQDPNPNSSASLTTTPSQSTASKIPESPTNSVITPPHQPPPAPPPPPSPRPSTHRNLAPAVQPNPLQQSAYNNYYVQPTMFVPQNQNQSAVLYQFSSPGRGFRPVRGFVADPSLMARNQNGNSPFPGLAFNHRQVAPNQMESMMQMQFLRGQMQQLARFEPGFNFGSGPMRARPQVWQPRGGRPRTPLLDAYKNRKARIKDEDLVLVRGRKVRITEGPSLYPLCRSWLKNGDHVGIQLQRSGTMKPLPKPLPVVKTDTSVPDLSESPDEDKEDEEAVKDLSEKDLLKRHINRAKKVRARFREERWRKIKRFTERLALLLPSPEGEVYTPEEDILRS